MNNVKIGSLYIIFSALSFSIMEIAVKISGKTIPVMEQVFARNFITLLIGAFVMFKNKEKLFPDKNNVLSIVCRSVSGYLGIISYFYAANNMVLADASVLQKTSPFWSSLFAFIIIKEKIFEIQWINNCSYWFYFYYKAFYEFKCFSGINSVIISNVCRYFLCYNRFSKRKRKQFINNILFFFIFLFIFIILYKRFCNSKFYSSNNAFTYRNICWIWTIFPDNSI